MKITVKQHIGQMHKALADHFGKCAECYSKMADATDDANAAQGFQKLAGLHEAASAEHEACASELCGDETDSKDSKKVAATNIPTDLAHFAEFEKASGSRVPATFPSEFRNLIGE